MKATLAIDRQHRNIRQLCAIVRSSGLGARRSLWPQLRNDLVSHLLVEERLVYSIVSRVDASLDPGEEHRTLRQSVILLSETRMDHVDFERTLEALESTLAAHFAEEEHVVFPLIDRALSASDNVALGAWIRHAYQNALEAGAGRRAPKTKPPTIERRIIAC
jgi:iron-sulfur cluster repair protein YtfE (RIC family)